MRRKFKNASQTSQHNYKLASTPLPDSSKMRSNVASKNVAAEANKEVMISSLIYSTIVFHALPLRALFLCPQPCHQPPVFEHVAEPSFLPVAVIGKDDFPKKWPKWAPFFSVFSVWRTESSPALICVAFRINALKT